MKVTIDHRCALNDRLEVDLLCIPRIDDVMRIDASLLSREYFSSFNPPYEPDENGQVHLKVCGIEHTVTKGGHQVEIVVE